MVRLLLTSMRSITVLVICVLLLVGCSSLIIHDDDNIAVVATKITVRTVNCALTLYFACISEWGFMEGAKDASMVWYGRGDINGDNYKCKQEASSRSSEATGYVYMPIGKNAMLLPTDSGGGTQINKELYHSCMRAHGYTLMDRYEYDRWGEKEANKSVSAPLGSLCGPSNVTIGTRLRRSQDGKMVKVTALYANSPRCSDPATPTPVDVEEIGEGESSVSVPQGSHCVASNATIGTQVRSSDGKMVTVKTLYGNSPRCSNPAIPILVDVE